MQKQEAIQKMSTMIRISLTGIGLMMISLTTSAGIINDLTSDWSTVGSLPSLSSEWSIVDNLICE